MATGEGLGTSAAYALDPEQTPHTYLELGALPTAGRQVFRILNRLRDELGVNSTCGASNVSFGLPNREGINGAFLAMAIASGLTSAITNPIADGVRPAVMAADVLQGNDRDAARWIRQFRVAPAEGEAGGRRVNRRRAGPEVPQRIAGTEAVGAAGG